MLNSQLLDYVIIALMIVVIINIFTEFFNIKFNKSNEGMNTIPESVNVQKILPTDGLDIGAPLSQFTNQSNQNNKINVTEPLQAQFNNNINTSSFNPIDYSSISQNVNDVQPNIKPNIQSNIQSDIAINKIMQLQQNNQDLSKKCPIKGTPYENDRYIKEFVLGGKFNCIDETPSKTFTRNEIIQYQNNMFDFHDQLFESTSNNIDVVDKLNELTTSGSKTTIGGQTISSIFDGLTQTQINKKKQCVNQNCLIPPQIDMVSKDASYIQDTNHGKFYRHGLMYEDDDVNTGGKYYDNIEARDVQFENKLIWTK